MAGLHILSNTMADQRWLRGAIDKRYKLVLVVFGEVFVFNLRGKENRGLVGQRRIRKEPSKRRGHVCLLLST